MKKKLIATVMAATMAVTALTGSDSAYRLWQLIGFIS